MKKFCVIAMVLLVASASFAQQRVFSVKSGSELEEAQFGFVMGSIQPFIGVDYFSLSAKMDVDESVMKVGASMWIASIGAKMFIGTNPTRPYIYAGFLKSFAGVNLTADGEDLLDDEALDPIKDLLSFTGFKVGFGAEYKINEHFSIAGEYGFYFYSTSTDLDGADLGTIIPDLGDIAGDIEGKLSPSMKKSKGLIVLNFYF